MSSTQTIFRTMELIIYTYYVIWIGMFRDRPAATFTKLHLNNNEWHGSGNHEAVMLSVLLKDLLSGPIFHSWYSNDRQRQAPHWKFSNKFTTVYPANTKYGCLSQCLDIYHKGELLGHIFEMNNTSFLPATRENIIICIYQMLQWQWALDLDLTCVKICIIGLPLQLNVTFLSLSYLLKW
jgi:hypothetical protein